MKQINTGEAFPIFIIAEISGNHDGDITQAKEMIKSAAKIGANAVKIQTYTADTMTLNIDSSYFTADGNWKGQTLYELYQKAHTPWEWLPELQKTAIENNIILFSTPFDETAVDFLEKYNMSVYKISSYEFTDIPLLKKVAQTGKSIIASTGFDTEKEIDLSIKTLKNNGAKDITILYCLTSYSNENKENCNLATMLDIKEKFKVKIGLSENSGSIEVVEAACLLGASTIEKHFVLEHNKKHIDDPFSLDIKEFENMIKTIRKNESIKNKNGLVKKIKSGPLFGKVLYGPKNENEKKFAGFRRVIVASKNIQKNEEITEKNIKCVRTNHAPGLPTKFYEKILKKKASQDIPFGTPIKEKFII